MKSLTRVCGVEGSRGGGGSEGLGDGGEPDWGGEGGLESRAEKEPDTAVF